MSDEALQTRLAQALAPLVGLVWWRTRRAADMAMFDFGPRRPPADGADPAWVDAYDLQVQCCWRLATPATVIWGRQDLWLPAAAAAGPDWPPPPDDYDYLAHGASLWDARRAAFDAARGGDRPVVQAVEVGWAGAFRLIFAPDLALEVLPGASADEEWALLSADRTAPHVVMAAEGLAFWPALAAEE